MSCSVLKRCESNPVLKGDDIPYDSSLVFNAGITKFNGKYVMVFRNDYGFKEEDLAKGQIRHKTNIGIAFSDDGVKWTASDKPCFELHDEEIRRAYDPRLTVIDGRCYMCFAVDTQHGVCGGIAVTDDFEDFEVLTMTAPDNRNMVLFPEKIGGKYVRLERPFPVYSRGGNEQFDIWISRSPDCRYWGENKLLLGAEQVPYANCKIGPGAPPIKTDKGWLTTIHAVYKDETREISAWHKAWHKAYYAGLMLLDLEDPGKVIGLYDKPLIAPEEDYELTGFRGEVIFPGGMVLEDDGEVKIYYGAADTVECLATAHVDDLVNLCLK